MFGGGVAFQQDVLGMVQSKMCEMFGEQCEDAGRAHIVLIAFSIIVT